MCTVNAFNIKGPRFYPHPRTIIPSKFLLTVEPTDDWVGRCTNNLFMGYRSCLLKSGDMYGTEREKIWMKVKSMQWQCSCFQHPVQSLAAEATMNGNVARFRWFKWWAESQHTKWHSCSTCVGIDPKWQPRENNNKESRSINTHHVKTNLSS